MRSVRRVSGALYAVREDFMRSVRHTCQLKPRFTRVVPTHSNELGQFQNHPVLTKVVEATIRDSEITVDLFQYLNN